MNMPAEGDKIPLSSPIDEWLLQMCDIVQRGLVYITFESKLTGEIDVRCGQQPMK